MWLPSYSTLLPGHSTLLIKKIVNVLCGGSGWLTHILTGWVVCIGSHCLTAKVQQEPFCFCLSVQHSNGLAPWVNGLCFLTTQSTITLQVTLPIHKSPMIASYHTECRSSHQKQFVVQYFAQGHFDMWTVGAGNRTVDLLISEWPSMPPEPQHLTSCCFHSEQQDNCSSFNSRCHLMKKNVDSYKKNS